MATSGSRSSVVAVLIVADATGSTIWRAEVDDELDDVSGSTRGRLTGELGDVDENSDSRRLETDVALSDRSYGATLRASSGEIRFGGLVLRLGVSDDELTALVL